MKCKDKIKMATEPMRELNSCVETQIMPRIMNFFKGPIEETVKDVLIEKSYDHIFTSVIMSVLLLLILQTYLLLKTHSF